MQETSKSIQRRIYIPQFITRYFIGKGIDIGAGNDSIANYFHFFPFMKQISSWDLQNGDAQFMKGVQDEEFDFVHSSHCLEHLNDPYEGIQNWWRILKKGGHLIITVPDEDLYEQGQFPSTFNSDHKWTFTIYKKTSWCEKSVNVIDIIQTLSGAIPLKIELLDATYRYGLERFDQTLTPIAESCIEIIIKKSTE